MRRIACVNCLFVHDASLAAFADSYCDEIEIVHSAGVPGTDAHSISAMVALLLHFVAAENGLDCDLRIAADFTGPVNEPFTVPLDMFRGSCQDTELLSDCYEIANKFAHKS